VRYTRREILKFAAMSPLAGLLLQSCGGDGDDQGLQVYEYEGPVGPENLFQHGVASGDPLPDAVMLWTRVSPASDEAVEVFWEVALDDQFKRRVAAEWLITDNQRDFTVKLDAAGLQPATTYFYRFQALGRMSAVGRTRTAPEGETDALRLAVVSCSSLGHGYFHAYRSIAQRDDIDLVLHLGDYIYEYGSGEYGAVRAYEPVHEILSLEDYRLRYAQYRRDPDLRAMHERFAVVAVWDDHEAADNSFTGGAVNHSDDSEGPWSERLGVARRVFSEWMPVRDQPDGRIHRAFQFGDLADLVMLDTRLWGRDRPAASNGELETINDPGRTLLGFDQEEWLAAQLRGSTARWKLIGQQVVFGQLKALGAPNSEGGGTIFNPDQWDGYGPARQRVFDLLRDEQLRNVVVLSGDIHSSGVAELTEDPNNPEAYDPQTGAGALAVEFVTPGVTSPAFPPGSNETLLPLILTENPHIKYADIERRGYLTLEVTTESVSAYWYHFADIEQRETEEIAGPAFVTLADSNRVIPISAA
jgi:alkaline phosphatase D